MNSNTQLLCNEDLFQRIKRNLKKFDVRPQKKNGLKQAAVALTVVSAGHGPGVYGMRDNKKWSDEAALVLTQRSSKLRNHAGQWALPGGRIDAGESPEETALRELSEEVYLKLNPESIIGRLDDYSTHSGYNITPIVVWGGPDVTLEPNPDEVDSIHRIPVDEFLREDAPILDEIPQSNNPVLRMPVGYSWIAAPTAALLYQFREVAILGNGTRVAHYEQPYFAWS